MVIICAITPRVYGGYDNNKHKNQHNNNQIPLPRTVGGQAARAVGLSSAGRPPTVYAEI